MERSGNGGARGGKGEPVWSRTRASRPGDPGRGAPTAASRRFAPDGLDGLRLGRPKLAMSRRTIRILAVLTLLLYAGPLVARWVHPRSNEPWPSAFEAAGLLILPMYAGFLASCRCESDVQAGRLARWAYGWDWTQLVLLIGAGSLCLWVGRPTALVFAGIAGLHLLVFGRQAWLRRRRARAAWSAEAVDDTFA